MPPKKNAKKIKELKEDLADHQERLSHLKLQAAGKLPPAKRRDGPRIQNPEAVIPSYEKIISQLKQEISELEK